MTGKSNLKGFRAPRVDAHIKNEVNKDQIVRLNIDIDKAKLQKLKIYLATNDLTMKQVITDYVDSLVGNK